MTVARRGSNRALRLASQRLHRKACPLAKVTSLSTMIRRKPANLSRRISSMTAPRNHGYLNESGTLNLHLIIPTPSTLALKTLRCSSQQTVARLGLNFRDYAATEPGLNGNRAQVACVCTRSSWTQRIKLGSLSPSRRLVHFAVTTAVQRGNQS